MFEQSELLLFTTAALLLIVAPGPSVMYIVARSVAQGRTAGLVSVLGIQIGALVHVSAAALGLSALLLASATAFNVVKYLGAIYLVWLGIRTLRAAGNADADDVAFRAQSLGRVFRQGVVVSTLNPKTALFFFAFLPQFVNPARSDVPLQIIILGAIFVAIAIASDSTYALLAGSAGNWLRQRPRFWRIQQRFAGGAYIALGLTTALTGRRG